MWRALLFTLVLPVLLLPVGAPAACPCVIHLGVCDEARQSDAVFIGTVEAVAPPFLNPYVRSSLQTAEVIRLQADPSPEALARLKRIYIDMFTGMPDYSRAIIERTQTRIELQKALEEVESEGRVAKFRVATSFKQGDDDDDDKAPKTLDIWTGSGECGVDFQVGETYLVYALEDEASGRLETSACMRTRRLSEETGDLAFLYFLQNAGKDSTRLEGFVSTSIADQNMPRYESVVRAPSAGAAVELDTGSGYRYTQSDAEGRFLFDGLKEGDYHLSLLAAGFPRIARTVLQSRAFHANAASCVRQVFVIKP